MGTLRCADLPTHSTEGRDLPSLTLDEFQQVVSPIETAFEARMAAWRLDGQPRTARRYTTKSGSRAGPPAPGEGWYPHRSLRGAALQASSG
jgi:hypothetical protein